MKNSILQTIAVLLIFFVWGFISAYSNSGPKQSLTLPNLAFAHKPYDQKALDQPGKKVIYVWATWCTICKSTKAVVEWNHKISKLFGIDFYSIEEGEDIVKLNKILKESEYGFNVLEGNLDILKSLEVKAYPTTIFVNSKSEKVFQDVGVLTPVGFFFRLFFL